MLLQVEENMARFFLSGLEGEWRGVFVRVGRGKGGQTDARNKR